MKHGSFWSVSLVFAFNCIWQVEISYPTSLPSTPIDLYLKVLKFQCVLRILKFSVANTVICKESYFRINVCWGIINAQRKQQGTKDSALWDTRQSQGLIRFCSIYNNSLLSVAQKTIYPFQCFPTYAARSRGRYQKPRANFCWPVYVPPVQFFDWSRNKIWVGSALGQLGQPVQFCQQVRTRL